MKLFRRIHRYHVRRKICHGFCCLPIIDLLHNEILKEKEEDKTLTNNIRLAIKADLMTRNTDSKIVELFKMCSFVDPRFKTKYLKDEDVLSVKAFVCDEAVSVHPKDNAASSNSPSTQSPQTKKK